MQIWNHEIIDNTKFSSNLKCADIIPIFKKIECVAKENYSTLPVGSKIFQICPYSNDWLMEKNI